MEHVTELRPPRAAKRPTQALLRRFDSHGPRYTSYPTADRMVEAYGAHDACGWLARRGLGAASGNLGLYVHVPFCESLCYYCACNKIVTRRREHAARYVEYLGKEASLYRAQLAGAAAVSQLHLGGGTPTYLDDDALDGLLRTLDAQLDLSLADERSIEVDPRTVDPQRLVALRQMGFNRISFGVQDFDSAVQQAVHRVQPAERVFELVAAARALQIGSVGIDLIYGLPRQTPASFDRTVAQVRQLRPDRIALYAYAHLPERFKPQRRIDAAELPAAADKVAMLDAAIEGLLDAGYVYVGMDHFALPDDALAAAKRSGTLHRNFQGYTAHADGDLIALGVSAISRIGPTYHQNAKTLDDYCERLDRVELPVARGIELSRDDLVRRAVIMALMCQGRVDFAATEAAFLIRFDRYFADELGRLDEHARLGLITRADAGIEVTALGWYFVRAIAMVFDRYLRSQQRLRGFSKIL